MCAPLKNEVLILTEGEEPLKAPPLKNHDRNTSKVIISNARTRCTYAVRQTLALVSVVAATLKEEVEPLLFKV